MQALYLDIAYMFSIFFCSYCQYDKALFSVTCYLELLNAIYIFTNSVICFPSKDVHYLFKNVQTTNLTFVDKKMRYTANS